MKQWPKFSLVAILLVMIVSAGCQRVLSQHIQAKAEHKQLMTAIHKSPDRYKGKTVIMGGQILSLTYRQWQTEIEFAELPLSKNLHPVLGIPPGLRYYVLFPERLDRSLYRRGNIVTLAANVIGTKKKGENSYPLFTLEEAHIWNRFREVRFPHYGAMLSLH